MTTSDTAVPEPSPEQAALFARVRRMMLIAGLTTALAICAVLIAVGYRLFKSEGRAPEPAGDVTATLPKGAKIVSSGVAGDRLVITLDVGGVTEIRTFDAHTLRPAGKLKFVSEPWGRRHPPSGPGLSRPSTSFLYAAKRGCPGQARA